ncbi:hypothetical protein LINGRAHAP2_LOCUS24216 [Linum grandiflorum]
MHHQPESSTIISSFFCLIDAVQIDFLTILVRSCMIYLGNRRLNLTQYHSLTSPNLQNLLSSSRKSMAATIPLFFPKHQDKVSDRPFSDSSAVDIKTDSSPFFDPQTQAAIWCNRLASSCFEYNFLFPTRLPPTDFRPFQRA